MIKSTVLVTTMTPLMKVTVTAMIATMTATELTATTKN